MSPAAGEAQPCISDEAEREAAQALLDAEWDWRIEGRFKHRAREHYSADCPLCRPDYGDNAQRIARVILAAALPFLEADIRADEREAVIRELRAKFGLTNRAADWLARGSAVREGAGQ